MSTKLFLLIMSITYASLALSADHLMPRGDQATLLFSKQIGEKKIFSGDFDDDGDIDTIKLLDCNLTININNTIQTINANTDDWGECSDTFVYIKPTVMIHAGYYGSDYGSAKVYEYDKKLKNWFYVGHIEKYPLEKGMKGYSETISKKQFSIDGNMTRMREKQSKAFRY